MSEWKLATVAERVQTGCRACGDEIVQVKYKHAAVKWRGRCGVCSGCAARRHFHDRLDAWVAATQRRLAARVRALQ